MQFSLLQRNSISTPPPQVTSVGNYFASKNSVHFEFELDFSLRLELDVYFNNLFDIDLGNEICLSTYL